jgi:serine/threonine protein kinase
MEPARIDPRFDGLVLVGTGSMGNVYRAWDRQTSSVVALKVPVSRMADRFWREARLLAALDHPNIVRYVGHGIGRSGHMWLAMEWLEGEVLTTVLSRGALTTENTLRVATPIAGALAWAHERRIVHRDLKPDNLFVVRGDLDRVKVLDFGLARPTLSDLELTATGVYMGTFEYMSPEQAVDAKRADASSDVFSFGAVLYHCLTGRPPRSEEVFAPSVTPLTSLRPDVPRDLADLVHAMLSFERDARPPNAGRVLRELQAIGADWDGPTIQTRTSEIREVSSTSPWGAHGLGPSGTVVMRRK